jgi:hypothetical protein
VAYEASWNRSDTTADDELIWEIDLDWEVFGADGKKIGTVRDVQPYHLVVRHGRFFSEQWDVPVAAITDVRGENVYINLTKADLEAGAGTPADVARGTDTVIGESVETQQTLQFSVPTEILSERPAAHDWTPNAIAQQHPAYTPRDEGIDTPLSIDGMSVTSRPLVSHYATGEQAFTPFAELDIIIPVRGERVVVAKQPVVYEVLDISKAIRERDERVTDTVRRERVIIEREDGSRLGPESWVAADVQPQAQMA